MNLSQTMNRAGHRRWLKTAGLLSLPLYAAPVGLWGVRGLRPRMVQNAVSGAIALGMVSLATWALARWSRSLNPDSARARAKKRWQLPIHGPLLPEEAVASAASGH